MIVKKVFIAHGHDGYALYQLKDFLRTLRLEPVVLQDEDDLGLTIFEKFDHYASKCIFGFAILTPDDRLASELPSNGTFRARQNVIFEAGWMIARYTRRNVILLHKGSVDLPSDITGILYLSFVRSILEVSEKIRQRLNGCGLL